MKKTSSISIVLSILIATLAIIVAGLGVFWQGEGQKSEFLTVRGETVTIQGHGLYQYETVSIATQAIAQDVVTLLIGIPLLVISMILFRKGSLRGKLLLSGTLAYFLYTYASFAFGAAYNILFLVYVSLFSLSLFAFIFALMQIDISTLPKHFSSGLPRRTIAIFLFVVGSFLLLAWLGRIVPALLANQPPLGLESYTTLIIQALDLGLVMPIAFLSGILLWKKSAWGYLLSSIVLIKGATLALAVSAMAVNMILAGVQVSTGELIIFPSIAMVSGGMTVVLLRNVTESGDKN
ncbi:MAG: hypothetical protein HZB51_15630 [Chloroflexi bacterium]|nr:hypothetical protein [Chloroflexota bacterium]